jgi:hypothetical protein
MIVCLLCLGFIAGVDWETGTIFGRAFANTLLTKAYNRDLNKIMIRVSNPLNPFLLDANLQLDFKCKIRAIISNYQRTTKYSKVSEKFNISNSITTIFSISFELLKIFRF